MTPFRWLLTGASLALAAGLASCGGVLFGEPVPCEHDADCGSGFICEGTVGRVCTLAIECTGDSQCPVGSSCIERSVSAPDNAFEGNHASKQVCDCLGDCGTGGFNAGGAPPVGGQGGSGGEPAGGQGGEPAGGQGGEPAGGEGGQGGSGGDPQGGAGGQGGAQ